MKVVLWAGGFAAVVLAFVWPLVSPDPASGLYRLLALVSLWGFLGAIAALVVRKAMRSGQPNER